MLIELKQYIKSHRLVSLLELATRFNLDIEVVHAMLALLIRKGNIRQRKKTDRCGAHCTKCQPVMMEMYEWVQV